MGFRCPPVMAAVAYMNTEIKKTLESPMYAPIWTVPYPIRVAAMCPDVRTKHIVPSISINWRRTLGELPGRW